MTVANAENSVSHGGNGVTTVFPFAFHIPTGTLQVTITDLSTGLEGDPLPDTAYTPSGLDNPAGGTVTYPASGTPLATGFKINIKRIVPLTQTLDLTNQSAFSPTVLEAMLDRIVWMVAQVDEKVNRASLLGTGNILDPDDFPETTLDMLGAGFVDPKMFGAVGDGVTDDSAALQACANYCATEGLGMLLRADNIYLCNADLDATGILNLEFRGNLKLGVGFSLRVGGFSQVATPVKWYFSDVYKDLADLADGSYDTVPDMIIAGVKGGVIFLGQLPYLQLYADLDDTAAGEASNAYFSIIGGRVGKFELYNRDLGWSNAINIYGTRIHSIEQDSDGSATLNQWLLSGCTMEGPLVEINLTYASFWRFEEQRFENATASPGVILGANTSNIKISVGYLTSGPRNVGTSVTNALAGVVPVSDAGRGNSIYFSALELFERQELCAYGPGNWVLSDGSRCVSDVSGIIANNIQGGAENLQVVANSVTLYQSALIEVPAEGLLFSWWGTATAAAFRPIVFCYDSNKDLITGGTPAGGVDFNSATWNASGFYTRSADAGPNMKFGGVADQTGTTRFVRLALRVGTAAPYYIKTFGIDLFVPRDISGRFAPERHGRQQQFYLGSAPVGVAPIGTQVTDQAAATLWHSERYADTYLDSAASGTDTTVTVQSATGMSNGDDILIALDNGDTHVTTINGAPAGAVVTLTDAMPSAAAAGRRVRTGNWITRDLSGL